jgi:hypothetical protein
VSSNAEIEKILETEFCPRFVKLMQNAMVLSFYKYGPAAEGFPHKVDAIASLKARLDKYKETGNTEWLVDAANFALIEFMHPRHPKAHFAGTDGDESPGRVARKTHKLDNRDNQTIGTNPNSLTAQFR